MSAAGIEAVFLESHNWGAAAAFFRSLGFTLDFETDHRSGQLRGAEGPYVFVAEVPEDRDPGLRVVLRVPAGFRPPEGVEVVSELATTHWGTQEMAVRDPDGRVWTLQVGP